MKAMVQGECRGDYIWKCVTAPLVPPTELEGRGECPWDYIGIVPVRIRAARKGRGLTFRCRRFTHGRMRAGLHLLDKKMSRTFLSPTLIVAANAGGTT